MLAGRKIQTRRIIPQSVIDNVNDFHRRYFAQTLDALSPAEAFNQYFFIEKIGKLPYKLGEVVAVAQSYKDADVHFIPEEDDEFGCHNFPAEQISGWTKKKFVRAALMPHRIRITNVRVERLQDISDEDCLAEGVIKGRVGSADTHYMVAYYPPGMNKEPCCTPREAYAVLIDRISDKDTWKSNPYVFVYDFELIK